MVAALSLACHFGQFRGSRKCGMRESSWFELLPLRRAFVFSVFSMYSVVAGHPIGPPRILCSIYLPYKNTIYCRTNVLPLCLAAVLESGSVFCFPLLFPFLLDPAFYCISLLLFLVLVSVFAMLCFISSRFISNLTFPLWGCDSDSDSDSVRSWLTGHCTNNNKPPAHSPQVAGVPGCFCTRVSSSSLWAYVS